MEFLHKNLVATACGVFILWQAAAQIAEMPKCEQGSGSLLDAHSPQCHKRCKGASAITIAIMENNNNKKRRKDACGKGARAEEETRRTCDTCNNCMHELLAWDSKTIAIKSM